uniref:Uncharacterized protein n=1 Tax=Tanacetum cinerariifolium TaxID=118510 RepID=A0A6L2K5V2_TANCI|nr:hypothetical protein [Tanacetum cinerariifolium]
MNLVATQEVALDNVLVCPKLPNQEFVKPPSDEEMVPFIKELRCIFGKSIGQDRLRPSRAQILWGMFYKKNVDFVALLWEDFMFQADNREISFARKENMPYPRFTKVIISHLIYKDKTIYIRNRINLHTIRDDSLLEEEPAKKPKPTKHPEPAKKSTPAKKDKALKRSKRDTTIHQAGGSSEGADSESKVPDEPKGKSIDTSEGTSLKLVVPNVSTAVSSESKNESWGDSGDEDNNKVMMKMFLKVMMIMNKLMINGQNPMIKKKKHKMMSTLTDAKPDDEDKGYKKMTNAKTKDADHVNVNQEGAGNQVKDDAQATQKTEIPVPSSSISSDYDVKYLNFDNIPLVDIEVVSMLDVNVQHEVPCTLSLLFIHVSVISEHNVINPPKTVITTSATTISSLMSSLFPHL